MSARAGEVDGRLVVIREPGGVEVLDVVARTIRAPARGEVRVAVRAAGVNRADLLQRRGLYPAPEGAPRDVPGLEFAGVVEARGEDARAWPEGARVMGIVSGGAMASHVLVHERELVPIPEGMSFTDAAAIPEAYFTAWDALTRRASLRSGDVLLVHAVGSGVGVAALALGRALGALVVGTTRSAEKLARLEAMGLIGDDQAKGLLIEAPPAFASALSRLTGGALADVILDTVGGSYLEENVRALAPLGTIVSIGLLGGAQAPLPLGLLLAKRGTLAGSVLRSRPIEEKIALAQRFRREVLPLFARGVLWPVVDRVLALDEIRAAHRTMESDANVGKIVLRIG